MAVEPLLYALVCHDRQLLGYHRAAPGGVRREDPEGTREARRTHRRPAVVGEGGE